MSSPPPPEIDDDMGAAIVDAMAAMLGIPIELAWRESVVANLKATANAARLVLEFPLDEELEPSPVFRA